MENKFIAAAAPSVDKVKGSQAAPSEVFAPHSSGGAGGRVQEHAQDDDSECDGPGNADKSEFFVDIVVPSQDYITMFGSRKDTKEKKDDNKETGNKNDKKEKNGGTHQSKALPAAPKGQKRAAQNGVFGAQPVAEGKRNKDATVQKAKWFGNPNLAAKAASSGTAAMFLKTQEQIGWAAAKVAHSNVDKLVCRDKLFNGSTVSFAKVSNHEECN